MHTTLNSLDLPLLLDILAFAASAVLIFILVANRRRYGQLIRTSPERASFGSGMMLQMVTQQSQRSYSNIQRTLNREFASLQRMTGGEAAARDTRLLPPRPESAAVSPARAAHYEEAARMIRNSADPQAIAERCGLSRGEIDLMAYMQRKRT